MGDGGLTTDDVACHLERVLHRRRRTEPEPPDGARVTTDDDHLAEVREGV